MDLLKLSDDELDALQLAVNTEIGMRLNRRRMAKRLASVFADAESNGVPFTEIDAAVVNAKREVQARNPPVKERKEPADVRPTAKLEEGGRG